MEVISELNARSPRDMMAFKASVALLLWLRSPDGTLNEVIVFVVYGSQDKKASAMKVNVRTSIKRTRC